MTENMAGRGEGLAGLVAKWRNLAESAKYYKEEARRLRMELAAEKHAMTEYDLHPPQRGQLLHLADPSNLKAGDAVYVLGEFLRPLDNGMDCEIEFESDQSLHSANVQLSDVCVAALATPSPQAPRKWGAEIAARAEFGDLSPTSAREQSAATASDNLSEGDIADIAMWLDDNLAIEEDAPFERRTELMEKAFRMVIEQAAETGGIAAEAYIENLDDGQVIRAEKCAEKVEDAIRGLKLSVPAATQEQPAGSTLEWLPQVEVIRTELMKRFSDKLSMEEIARCAYSLAGSPRKVGEDGAQPVAFVIETEGGDLYDRGHVIFSDARQAQDRADDLNSELEKESFRVAPLYRALSLSSLIEPPSDYPGCTVNELALELKRAVMVLCETRKHTGARPCKFCTDMHLWRLYQGVNEPVERDASAIALEFLATCSKISLPTGNIPAPTTEEVRKLISSLAPSRQGAGGK